MVSYKVKIKKSALKEIESIDKKFIPLIWKKIKSLKRNPRLSSSKKLKGSKKSYRLVAASYRIIYQIDDDTRIVTVYAVGHRKDIYR